MVHCVSIPDAVDLLAYGEDAPEWFHFSTIDGSLSIRSEQVTSIKVTKRLAVDLSLETEEVVYAPVDWSGHVG